MTKLPDLTVHNSTRVHKITIVPLFKNFWDNLRGQKSLGPLKMSLEMAHKVIVPQKKSMSRSFLNSGTLIVILHFNFLSTLLEFRLYSYFPFFLGREGRRRRVRGWKLDHYSGVRKGRKISLPAGKCCVTRQNINIYKITIFLF